ncbi:YopX family protein [Bacillus cereus]|uniref:YopX family protein n=1 Tax=Bacillus thuringiensis TaxID=1428 RepID=UPI001066BC1F|nr:YopX family protein [Bacillus thuringiensis]MCU5409290.1 YopX family protein [Bacillus cereus]MDA2416856.1 YopX family protein [Bacillus cereus]TEA81236.1 hypothetical protein PBMB05447_22980 [Bacillus thuringiensis F14-1]
MREIKFRVWCKEGPSMLNWDYLINEPDFVDFMKGAHEEDAYYSRLMQYTGLKDKNGKEIYEGDIVKCHNDLVYIVDWHEEDAMFYYKDPDGDEEEDLRMSAVSFEVIGNVYDNQNLIK